MPCRLILALASTLIVSLFLTLPLVPTPACCVLDVR